MFYWQLLIAYCSLVGLEFAIGPCLSPVVTPTKEEFRFAQSNGVVSASSDEIASAKDLVLSMLRIRRCLLSSTWRLWRWHDGFKVVIASFVVTPSPVVTPRNEESRFAKSHDLVSGFICLVTPAQCGMVSFVYYLLFGLIAYCNKIKKGWYKWEICINPLERRIRGDKCGTCLPIIRFCIRNFLFVIQHSWQ